jgi:hypothetical protein
MNSFKSFYTVVCKTWQNTFKQIKQMLITGRWFRGPWFPNSHHFSINLIFCLLSSVWIWCLNLVSYFVKRDEANILNYFTFQGGRGLDQKWKYFRWFSKIANSPSRNSNTGPFNPLNPASRFCVFQVPLSNNRWQFLWYLCHNIGTNLQASVWRCNHRRRNWEWDLVYEYPSRMAQAESRDFQDINTKI